MVQFFVMVENEFSDQLTKARTTTPCSPSLHRFVIHLIFTRIHKTRSGLAGLPCVTKLGNSVQQSDELVANPLACESDDMTTMLCCGLAFPWRFDLRGIRVPAYQRLDRMNHLPRVWRKSWKHITRQGTPPPP